MAPYREQKKRMKGIQDKSSTNGRRVIPRERTAYWLHSDQTQLCYRKGKSRERETWKLKKRPSREVEVKWNNHDFKTIFSSPIDRNGCGRAPKKSAKSRGKKWRPKDQEIKKKSRTLKERFPPMTRLELM